jgi:hypothetical protein
VAELGLAEKEERSGLQKRGKWGLHGDKGRDVGEAGTQAAEACENQSLIRHGLPDVAEGVGEGLEALAVGGDGLISLDDGAELGFEVDGASHLVVEEEVADAGVGLERSLLFGHDDVEDLLADGAVEPQADDKVLAVPLRGASHDRGVDGDVVGELILAEKDDDEHVPL